MQDYCLLHLVCGSARKYQKSKIPECRLQLRSAVCSKSHKTERSGMAFGQHIMRRMQAIAISFYHISIVCLSPSGPEASISMVVAIKLSPL